MRKAHLLLFLLLSACNQPDQAPTQTLTSENTTVLQALMDGNPKQAARMLAHDSDLDKPNKFGDTALIWAANTGQSELVAGLIAKGANVDHRGSKGKTALHWAAHRGDGDSLMALVQAGANINAADADYETPMMIAARRNGFATVRFLANHAGDVNATDKHDQTALHHAVKQDAGQAVEALILSGAKLDVVSLKGETPLEMALRLGRAGLFLTEEIKAKLPNIGSKLNSLYQVAETNKEHRPRYKVDKIKTMIHDLVNAERRKENLNALAYDNHLERIALSHSRDMLTYDFFSHTNHQGESPTDRGKRMGYEIFGPYKKGVYKNGIGENIFSCSTYEHAEAIYEGNTKKVTYKWRNDRNIAEAAVKGWMESPGHRANILGDKYVREGVGVVISTDDRVMITQNFW